MQITLEQWINAQYSMQLVNVLIHRLNANNVPELQIARDKLRDVERLLEFVMNRGEIIGGVP